jgi:RNA polymerase sigma factor (sigma-70 family)
MDTEGGAKRIGVDSRVKSRRRAIRSGWRVVCLGVRRLGLPVDQLPDDTLLAGLGDGDPEVSVAFVRRFQRRVYGVALAVLGDPRAAEDVAQQAFERAWRHAGTYDTRRGSVGTWLTTITRNLAIDAARVRRPQPVDPEELLMQVAGSAEGPERRTLAAEVGEEMRAALRELPAEQARALVLSGIAGYSASQVAEAENIPLGTAKTRIRTAMHRLRDILSDDLVEGPDHG